MISSSSIRPSNTRSLISTPSTGKARREPAGLPDRGSARQVSKAPGRRSLAGSGWGVAPLAPYTAVVSARYRNLLQYRAAAFAGFVTQLFWGSIRLMILAAFYAAAEGPQPMNMVEVVAYVWLGQALLGMLPWNTDADFKEQIASGAVAYDLLRPLDLYGYWYARTLAFRTATTTLRAIPMVVFAMLLLPAFGLAEWALPVPTLGALMSGSSSRSRQRPSCRRRSPCWPTSPCCGRYLARASTASCRRS